MFRAPGFMINKLIFAVLPISQGDQETLSPPPPEVRSSRETFQFPSSPYSADLESHLSSLSRPWDAFPCSGCCGITVQQEFEAFLPSLGLALLFWISYLIPSFTAYKEGLIILILVSHCKDETRPSGKPHMSKALWISLLFFMWCWKEEVWIRGFRAQVFHSGMSPFKGCVSYQFLGYKLQRCIAL